MRNESDSKKNRERTIIGHFREACTVFPNGRLSYSESPDFILRTSSGNTLGIELTRLSAVPSHRSHVSREEEMSQAEFIQHCQEEFERKYRFPLFTAMIFRDGIMHTMKDGNLQVIQITDGIWGVMSRKDPGSATTITLSPNQLPSYLDLVTCAYQPSVRHSCWNHQFREDAAELNRSSIEERVRMKEEKIPLYQKKWLDNYWLVICVENPLVQNRTNFVNDLINRPIDSVFQKIFLFEIFKQRAYEIK